VTVDPDSYFAANESAQQRGGGAFVTWDELSPIEMLPGLTFQPVLAENVMVNFVRFAADTVVPVHWHDEEQITFVLEGELEFELAGEKRIVHRGEAVVIPSNVPHGARTYDTTCLEVDVFHPPRRGVLEAIGKAVPT
jgi:quercetin dioxygenase-like cupin family protein